MVMTESFACLQKMAEGLAEVNPALGLLVPLPSGYDEEFVGDVEDECTCSICFLPLREPVLTRCGHRFCKSCLEEHFRRQAEVHSCPVDREVLDQDRDVFPDKATERKILSLFITCPSESCEWIGELRSKKNHLATCPFQVVCCTNKWCSVQVKRKDLEEHVTITCDWQMIACTHCQESHPKCKIEDHQEKCTKRPVLCSNKCGSLISRDEISYHQNKQCPLTLIPCPYVDINCEEQIERKTLQSHLKTAMALHLELACIKLNETNVRLKNTEVELRNLQEKQRKLAQLNDTQKLVWKIGSFSKVMEKAKKGEQPKIESFPFYTEQYGYKTKIVLYPHGLSTGENTHLSIFYTCMKGEYDAILPWPMEKVFKVTIIDQQNVKTGNEEKLVHFWAHSLSCFKRPINDTSAPFYRGWDKFMSHNELRTRRYLVDDTLFIQVEVYSP